MTLFNFKNMFNKTHVVYVLINVLNTRIQPTKNTACRWCALLRYMQAIEERGQQWCVPGTLRLWRNGVFLEYLFPASPFPCKRRIVHFYDRDDCVLKNMYTVC